MYLELVLTIVVGSILTAVLLMCYVYVFRQLCCPPPRHRSKRQAHLQQMQDEANGGDLLANSSRARESLPLNLTGMSSQPTETDKV